jgi:excisionase family DNA binding protein
MEGDIGGHGLPAFLLSGGAVPGFLLSGGAGPVTASIRVREPAFLFSGGAVPESLFSGGEGTEIDSYSQWRGTARPAPQGPAKPQGRRTAGMDNGTEWLTLQQVADRLQVSTKTVTRWTRGPGALLAAKVGNTVRIRARSLEKWLSAREGATA